MTMAHEFDFGDRIEIRPEDWVDGKPPADETMELTGPAPTDFQITPMKPNDPTVDLVRDGAEVANFWGPGILHGIVPHRMEEPPRRIELTMDKPWPAFMDDGTAFRGVMIVAVDPGGGSMTAETLIITGRGYLFLIRHDDMMELQRLGPLKSEALRLLTLNERWSVREIVELVLMGPDTKTADALVKATCLPPAVAYRIALSVRDWRRQAEAAVLAISRIGLEATKVTPRPDRYKPNIVDAVAKKLAPPPSGEPFYHWYGRNDQKKSARHGPRGKQNRKGKKR